MRNSIFDTRGQRCYRKDQLASEAASHGRAWKPHLRLHCPAALVSRQPRQPPRVSSIIYRISHILAQGPFVYRLGRQVFILVRGVRFPYGLLGAARLGYAKLDIRYTRSEVLPQGSARFRGCIAWSRLETAFTASLPSSTSEQATAAATSHIEYHLSHIAYPRPRPTSPALRVNRKLSPCGREL